MNKDLRIIFTLGLIILTIYFCFRNIQLHQQVNKLQDIERESSFSKSKSDTVYLTKPYSPIQVYPTIQVPNTVTYYDQVKEVRPSSNNQELIRSSDQATRKDSLVQFLLDKSNLKVSAISKDSSNTYKSISKDFELNLDFYKYNWINNQLTYKRIPFLQRLKPYTYVSYRYFYNVIDCGIGLSFKTKTLIYKVGINTFYYPQYKKDLGLDLELKLEYNF